MTKRVYLIPKNSATGPNVNAGKNDNAATINITANINIPNVPVSVFNVPALSGTYFFFAIIPAMANGPMIGRYLPINIIIPSLMFQKGTLALNPANSDPLFADADKYSYII